jgi:hypothetical protein
MQPSPNHIVLLCRNRSVWRFGLLLLLLLLPQLQLSLVQSQDAAAGTGTCEVDVADGTCRPNNPLVEEDSLHQHEEKTRDEHHDSEEADDSASTAGRSRDQSSLSSYNFSFVDGYLVVDKELGVQQLYDPSLRGKFEERWQQTLEYMQDRKPKLGDDKGETPLIECLLKHESCLAWSLRDECDSNPGAY